MLIVGTVFSAIVAVGLWGLGGRSRAASATREAAGVSRELSRLDPFSFFVIPGHEYGLDHVVVGTTGAYAIRVGRDTVDGRYRKDIAHAKRGAVRVRRGAGQAAIHTKVQPVVCLPGRQFAPTTRRGVRVIPWGRLVPEIAERSRTVLPNQARRFAEALGGLPAPRMTKTRVTTLR